MAGQKRVAEALGKSGTSHANTHTLEYGEENPQCTEQVESCWQKNRRGFHIVVREEASVN